MLMQPKLKDVELLQTAAAYSSLYVERSPIHIHLSVRNCIPAIYAYTYSDMGLYM